MTDKDNTSATAELRAAEQSVEAHSAVFKKELGLTDLVLTQILFIIGLSWVGAAAKLGPSHIVFWLLAILLFYVPSAVVVIYLNRLMPLEGGLYQWAKLGFNEFIGFIVAWNLWLFVIVLTSLIGLQAATYLSYALGPNAAWLGGFEYVAILAGECRDPVRTINRSVIIAAPIIAANIIGAAIFLLAEKRRRSRRADAMNAPAD